MHIWKCLLARSESDRSPTPYLNNNWPDCCTCRRLPTTTVWKHCKIIWNDRGGPLCGFCPSEFCLLLCAPWNFLKKFWFKNYSSCVLISICRWDRIPDIAKIFDGDILKSYHIDLTKMKYHYTTIQLAAPGWHLMIEIASRCEQITTISDLIDLISPWSNHKASWLHTQTHTGTNAPSLSRPPANTPPLRIGPCNNITCAWTLALPGCHCAGGSDQVFGRSSPTSTSTSTSTSTWTIKTLLPLLLLL